MKTDPPFVVDNASLKTHPIVSHGEWLAGRKELLAEEKEFFKERDRIAVKRRALPWVKVDKNYTFESPNGKVSLADLFFGKSQLIVYHFMFAPGWKEGCTGCSFLCDHVDSARQHFEHRDVAFTAISRAPLAEFQDFKKRMGWKFNWISSNESDFNYDYGVSFTEKQVTEGKAFYNYAPETETGESHGISIFYQNDAGEIFHTYSTYARGAEEVMSAFMFMDLTPKGRNEESVMNWVRLHDQYDSTPKKSCCCGD